LRHQHLEQRSRVWVGLLAVGAMVAMAPVVASTASASAPVAAVVVEPSGGSGKPTPGSGIGTQAALDNPRCTDADDLAGFGRFDSFAEGAGPICVRPFEAGEDNGGATSRGVTAESVKVVYLVPTANAEGQTATNRVSGQTGSDRDAVHDLLIPMMQYFETWGRNIEIVFFPSSGNDEAAQRADAIGVLGEKPFAVINGDTTGLDVFEAEIAKSKTLVFGYGANPNEAIALAPYRWGGPDANVALINTAEVVGKQLDGKKAEWAGSADLQKATRKFGLVTVEEIFDLGLFEEKLDEFDVTLTEEMTYPGNGGPFGDTTISTTQAPSIVGRMKQSGVTTVLLGADVAMTKALMEEASKQDWFPEWFQTGFTFIDYQPFTSTYPPDQVAHMFGLSILPPFVEADTDPAVKQLTAATAPLDWYWGTGAGTQTPRIIGGISWLLTGIHSAGPKLTPKTFQQGLFSIPASGGSASDTPIGAMSGFGKTTGLPYPGYFATSLDFAPEWIGVGIEGLIPAQGLPRTPSQMFVDGGNRYKSGDWPTKKIPFFEESDAITSIKTRPASSPAPVPIPCTGCPSTGGAGTTGSPSESGFVAEVPSSTTG
jgi:hypothetical protein